MLLLILVVAIFSSCLTAYADECPEGGDHDYEVELIKQASNTEDGLRRYTCKKCGYTFDEVIENFGHVWSEWEVVTAPGCETIGMEERHCTKCDDFEQRYVENLGHDWGSWHEEGNKEVRECRRDPSHREERTIVVIESTEETDNQEPVEEPTQAAEPEPEPEPEAESEPEPAPEPAPEPEPEPEPEQNVENAPAVETEAQAIEEKEEPARKSWIDDWTPANTAVATGGGAILIGLGALLFTSYISPWLWIMAKRRKKREEVQRSMYT